MDAHSALHPTDEKLISFGLGKLDQRAADVVKRHLQHCPTCQRRVVTMSADSFAGRVRDTQKPAVDRTFGQPRPGATKGSVSPSRPAPPPAKTLPPGLADHPDYQIKHELGRGGMGVVYLAHNTMMGRDEVLKVMGRQLMDRPDVLERFLREIRAVAKLRHANIVTAYHATRLGDSLVFAMEYVKGYDLAQLVKGQGPLPVALACNFTYQAALGLQHAHEEGLVHRDIKPGNLMLARNGQKATVKILDFGLARATREQKVNTALTNEGQALGTPDFIAPEQILNAASVDIRADIYSLGGTLFYLLSGRPPFEGQSLYDVYQGHISRDAGPLNLIRLDVPAELAALVAKMMAKDPARRFQTPAEVAQALVPFFKNVNAAVESPKWNNSQAGQSTAGQSGSGAMSAPARPATDSRGAAARAKTVIEPAFPVDPWQSLMTFRNEDRSHDAAPVVVEPSRRRLPGTWQVVVAASAIGLIAWGIILAMRTNSRETKIIAPGDNLPPHESSVSLSDPVPQGSVWLGWRYFPGADTAQACELKIASRGETRFAGEMTIMHLPGEPDPLRAKVNGQILGENVTLSTEKIGDFQQNFDGKLSGQQMRFNFGGTTRYGMPAQGEAVLALKGVGAVKALRSGDAPLRKETLKGLGIVASWFGMNDPDGWITLNENGTPDATSGFKVDTNESNQFWLVAWNIPNGTRWGWEAPKKFRGNLAEKFGGLLIYRIWTYRSESPPSDAYVRLTGGGKEIFVDGTTLDAPESEVWRNYSIRLDASGGWKLKTRGGRATKATDDDIKQVLSMMTSLWIKGEYGNGPDAGCLFYVLFLGRP